MKHIKASLKATGAAKQQFSKVVSQSTKHIRKNATTSQDKMSPAKIKNNSANGYLRTTTDKDYSAVRVRTESCDSALPMNQRLALMTPSWHSSDISQAHYGDFTSTDHRLSCQTDHQRQRDDLQIPTPEATPTRTSSKRKRRCSATDRSPQSKKVRFDPSVTKTRQIRDSESPFECMNARKSVQDEQREQHQIRSARSSIANLSEHQSPVENSDGYLLASLVQSPQILSVSQISRLFQLIQEETEQFAQKWFGNVREDSHGCSGIDMSGFPIHDLEYHHPALFWTATNILISYTSDRVQSDWIKFFDTPKYRQYLVYAILGEWFTQRIFKDTAFGLGLSKRQQMESVDVQYLQFDGFVRAKKRAAIVKQLKNSRNAVEHLEALNIASSQLRDELLIVISPLLPSFGSDLDDAHSDQQERGWKSLLRAELMHIIQQCAALNLSIVRTGVNGTLIRIAARFPNGEEFTQNASVRCVNKDLDKLSGDTYQRENLVVRMTCWPRVEAYVPHGIDIQEMDELQTRHRLEPDKRFDLPKSFLKAKRTERAMCNEVRDEFCWECLDTRNYLDVLPEELWTDAVQNRQKEEVLLRSANKSATRCILRNNDLESEPPRGCWVTFYDCVAPHIVYCERANPNSECITESEGNKADLRDKAIVSGTNLPATVREARQNLKSIRIRYEDAVVRFHDLYASNNLWIEWVGLVAVAFYLSASKNTSTVSGGTITNILRKMIPPTEFCIGALEEYIQQLISSTCEVAYQFPHWLNILTSDSASTGLHYLKDIFNHDFEFVQDRVNEYLASLTCMLPQPAKVDADPNDGTGNIDGYLKAAMLSLFDILKSNADTQ